MGALKLSYYQQGQGLLEKNPFFLKRGLEKNARVEKKRLSSYRYGFQGQELDNEVKGSDNSVNFKYRMHDPRVGRFFAVDPLAYTYPHNSPYAFAENRVVDGVELEGLEYSTVHVDLRYTSADFTKGDAIFKSMEWYNDNDHEKTGDKGRGELFIVTHYDVNGEVLGVTQHFHSRQATAVWVIDIDYGHYVGSTPLPILKFNGEITQYYLPPVNGFDAAALEHDQAYDAIHAAGESSVNDDWGTIEADLAAITKWDKIKDLGVGAIDPYMSNGQLITDEGVYEAGIASRFFKGKLRNKNHDIHVFIFNGIGGQRSIEESLVVFRDIYMIFNKGTGFWERNDKNWNKNEDGSYKPKSVKQALENNK